MLIKKRCICQCPYGSVRRLGVYHLPTELISRPVFSLYAKCKVPTREELTELGAVYSVHPNGGHTHMDSNIWVSLQKIKHFCLILSFSQFRAKISYHSKIEEITILSIFLALIWWVVHFCITINVAATKDTVTVGMGNSIVSHIFQILLSESKTNNKKYFNIQRSHK